MTPETENKLRLGVIGAGWFASRRHLPDAQRNPDVVLAALCRRDDDARAKLAAHFNVAPEATFADWRAMLDAGGLDAVLIATPHALHFEQAQAALERGLHVLLEKPMTVRADDARALVALARKNDRRLAVALNPPYWAHCHRLRAALQDPAMGALESAMLYWTGSAEFVFGRAARPDNLPGVVPPTMYRADTELNGGGYLIDGGSHLVSELLWVTGLRARRVSALLDDTPGDMRGVVSLEMENGAVASITLLGDSKHPARRVHNVFGCVHGTATIREFAFETTLVRDGLPTETFCEADLPPVTGPIDNFADAILGRAPLHAPGEHGAHVVEVVAAAYESASSGQAVRIAESSA